MFIYIPDQETVTPPSGSVDWGDIGGGIGDNAALEYQLLKMFWIYS
jgi:hypothetical protein